MEYLSKSSAIIVIFYACYNVFLQHETFFNSNRWFFIIGLVTALFLPMLVIPIYIEVPVSSYDGFTILETSNKNISQPFDWHLLLEYIYGIGVTFFLMRLITQALSLVRLIKTSEKKKNDQFTFIETSHSTTPFSFFRWIVYNPKSFSSRDLELILKHEKVHAKGMHSFDVLLIELFAVLFWFNPIIWLYRKALKQNLEFIADSDTQKQNDCNDRYQKLLLRTCLHEQHLMFINPFFNSTIKKRILMLHKPKSKFTNAWKYCLVVPLLVIFAMTFNTKTIAQTTVAEKEIAKDNQQNILTFVVTKDTKEKQLEVIKDKLADNGATITFKNVKRNSKNEITGIKILYHHENTKLVHSKKLSEPIKSIGISMNPSTGKIEMGEQDNYLIQTFKFETDDEGRKIITESNNQTNNDSFRIIGNSIKRDATNTDTIFIENTTEAVIYKNTIDENNKFITVKKTNSETHFFKNEETSPLVLFDGKEIKNDEMEDIDINSIGHIEVLKDHSATKKYGKKGANGVILISSKKDGFSKTKIEETTIIFEDENQKSIATSNNVIKPLYLLDGIEISKEDMEAIDPNTIESVDVLKNKVATKKYGERGENGVILITTKK